MEYNTNKAAQLYFWTYLFQITIVSLFLLIWLVLVVSDTIPHHMGTAFGRNPWLTFFLPFVYASLSIASCIATVLYRRGTDAWVNWTIVLGIFYTVFFIMPAFRAPLFSIICLYSVCMICVNLANIAGGFRLAQRLAKEEHHIVSKNDNTFNRYDGSYYDCLTRLKEESEEFQRAHKIISDREFSRNIRNRPILL